MLKELDVLSNKEDKKSCKGLFWRGRESSYFNGTEYHSKKSIHLLKRKSCSGCESCDWFTDFLNEDEYNEQLEIVEHGKTYIIELETSEDWETGHIEVDGWFLVEVEE